MSEVTHILEAIENGDARAVERLFPLVYDELRQMAAAQMSRENPGQTLDATALVHEAYLRLVGEAHFANRRHFFAACAEAMRRILVEQARRRQSLKRGGDARRLPLDDVAAPDGDDQLLALDEALTRLSAQDEPSARVVELHHFAGLAYEQVAEVTGLSVYQVRQKWAFARAWLKATIADG